MKEIRFGQPLVGEAEKAAVLDVLNGPTLVHGPRTTAFEADFAAWTGAPRAVAVSSCTAAMHLAYFCLDIGPGDEVIVPAMTHVATAHAVELTGARPVFVDADPDTGNLDLDTLAQALSPRTKAISVVHFLGVPVDMARVMAFAQAHGLFVVEDCAVALGSRIDDIHVGLFGDIGAFSFYPVKHITTAEGGMVISRRPELAERIARARAFGVDRTPSERSTPGVYDVPTLGFNYRMSEIEAALGIEQIKRLDGFLDRRRRNDIRLRERLSTLPGIGLFREPEPPMISSHYCRSILLAPDQASRRDQLAASLNGAGIGTSVYYPRPVPHMTYYAKKYGYSEDDFPVASRISTASIALPVGPHLDETDMERIADGVKAALKEVFQ